MLVLLDSPTCRRSVTDRHVLRREIEAGQGGRSVSEPILVASESQT
jgi:hypothetical protein